MTRRRRLAVVEWGEGVTAGFRDLTPDDAALVELEAHYERFWSSPSGQRADMAPDELRSRLESLVIGRDPRKRAASDGAYF